MMRRNVDTTPTARACQIASLLLVLIMVLSVLAHDIVRTAGTADATAAVGDKRPRLPFAP
jgi:hypothetical protein